MFNAIQEKGGVPDFMFMEDLTPYLTASKEAEPAAPEVSTERKVTEVTLTPTDAIKFLRNRRSKGRASFHIAVGQHAPIEGKPDKVFPVMAYVSVTLKVAEQFLTDAYRDTLVERGARVRLSYSDDSPCIFIGLSAA